MMTTDHAPARPGDANGSAPTADALIERLFGGALAAIDLLTVYVGDRLGIYAALHERGPATSAQLAERTGLNERYVREWLEQQAVGSFLEVDDPTGEAGARRYTLPEAYVEPLLSPDSLAYIAFVPRFLPSVGAAMPAVLEAFRSGGGVSWETYGDDMREAQAAQNRPLFTHVVAKEWLPSIADVHAKLSAPGARAADVACGGGWLAIALATAYPTLRVDGLDADEASIDLATANAAQAGVGDRVRFVQTDAATDVDGRYDVVLMWEALHDLSGPVEALRNMRRIAGDDGIVLVGDERVAEEFTGPTEDPIERFMYGASVLVCLPGGMAEQPSAATGTVMRTATVRRYASDAGFREVEILPMEHDFFRLYRLRQ
jgi:2-polyprenyl-3-methyl-5-hydroxy-6-metoxy-1,4-benzoquinol methylase